MTVAELAKRFENVSVSDTVDTPSPMPVGRVRELTRRLEHAVHTRKEDTSFGSAEFHHDDMKNADVEEEHEQQLEEEEGTEEDTFPSPPLLPKVSDVLSPVASDTVSKERLLTSTTSANSSNEDQSINVLSKLQSPSTPPQNNIRLDIPDSEHSPEKLTLQQRLARYQQLTSPAPTPPSVTKSHPPTLQPSPPLSPLAGPSNGPQTPSTEFSEQTSSASSEQRVEIIPDVSEGDLDDIEGVERVEDEERVENASTSTDTFDGETTFRRAQTIETLPSEPQSYDTFPGIPPPPPPLPPPSNPGSSSNASENSSFSSAEFASATEEFHQDRPAPHTLAVPSAPRMQSNLSMRPHTLHIAPGSFKKLPKAKVMIARRRHDDDVRISHDDASGRKLIREYENPKELLEGNVSLVELSDDESVDFRDPEISDARRNTSIRKKHRADAFRHRFDEFMDVQELERVNEIVDEDVASSKEKYSRRRLFRRGKVEKARQREERVNRQREAVARRSTVISGALDRVSLAADPWIDFITDNNTLPAVKAGGLRRGLKRLFGFGRPNAALIKSSE